MKKVMCFGTFDMIHPGHLDYFRQAKEYGDYLVVVVARDKTKQDQGKELLHSEQERLTLVQSVALVDEAILGNHGNHFRIILEQKPEVICLGYDHLISEEEVQKRVFQPWFLPQIVRARAYHPELYKTSLLQKFK